jgi:HD superfamily phosphohydrolase YqeK
MPNPFAGLETEGGPLQTVRRFLRQAGRLDTLKHSAQVNAAARKLKRRLWLESPSPSGRPPEGGKDDRGEGELYSIDLACTAHDLAAMVPLRQIIEVAEQFNVPLSDADRAIPQVVHGPVAAAVLAQKLGVTDENLLNAVRHHTTLRAHAPPLEQLVFIADKIAHDPTARHTGFHPALLAAQNTASLPELCFIYLDWAVKDGPRLGWQLHPNLVEAWKWLR